MSPLPTFPSCTGESWEIVEMSRTKTAQHIDFLVDAIATCGCQNAPDSLEHFDSAVDSVINSYGQFPQLYPAMLAEALTRLAAARKAGKL